MSIVRIYAPSWGRLDDRKRLARSFAEGDIVPPGRTALAYGQGRSYGDTCHNDDAVLLTTGQHQKIISFDTQTGILQAQAGAVLADILSSIGDSGWFLPVVPGTKFVTLGGAIANDIHGKNHQTRGTFGCHVKGFQLWRSDTGSLNCSRQENAELFNTTIGGLGLTGVITHANIQLMKVPSHFVQETRTPFASLEQFFERDDQLHSGGAAEPEYSVAWVDSLAKGAGLGARRHDHRQPHRSRFEPGLRSTKVEGPFHSPDTAGFRSASAAFQSTLFSSQQPQLQSANR